MIGKSNALAVAFFVFLLAVGGIALFVALNPLKLVIFSPDNDIFVSRRDDTTLCADDYYGIGGFVCTGVNPEDIWRLAGRDGASSPFVTHWEGKPSSIPIVGFEPWRGLNIGPIGSEGVDMEFQLVQTAPSVIPPEPAPVLEPSPIPEPVPEPIPTPDPTPPQPDSKIIYEHGGPFTQCTAKTVTLSVTQFSTPQLCAEDLVIQSNIIILSVAGGILAVFLILLIFLVRRR